MTGNVTLSFGKFYTMLLCYANDIYFENCRAEGSFENMRIKRDDLFGFLFLALLKCYCYDPLS